MDLLGLFASQAAIALELLGSARRAREALVGDSEAEAVARIAGILERLEGPRREAGLALLEQLALVLA